eukprot:5156553-Pyramimonas_sp.AAC.1
MGTQCAWDSSVSSTFPSAPGASQRSPPSTLPFRIHNAGRAGDAASVIRSLRGSPGPWRPLG